MTGSTRRLLSLGLLVLALLGASSSRGQDKGADEDAKERAQIEKDLDDPDVEKRAAAVKRLVERHRKSDFPLFEKAWHDADSHVRALVLVQILEEDPKRESLFELRDRCRVAGEALIDSSATLRNLGAHFLFNVPDVSLLPADAIEKVLADSQRDENERFHALQIVEGALERGRALVSVAALERLAHEAKNPELKGRATAAWEKTFSLGSENVASVTSADVAAILSTVRARTSSDSKWERLEGYRIVAGSRLPGAAGLLLDGLDDESTIVRSFVARSLRETTNRATLRELFRRESELEDATKLIDQRLYDDRRSLVPALIDALEDDASNVRARAWARLRAVDLLDELGKFDPDGSPDERRAAVGRARTWWRARKGD